MDPGRRDCRLTRRSFLTASAALGLRGPATAAAARDRDWPMLAHDAARSGATAAELRPPFARKWYRLFADEGLQSGVQPVIAEGRVYIGTLRGALHAMDAETGKDLWVAKPSAPILHAAAVAPQRVFVGGADGAVRAFAADDGKPIWRAQTGAALWNAPAVVDDIVLVGGRDARLRALDAATGHERWVVRTGGPILSSPAVDERRGRVYVAAEDMRVTAADLASGRELWRSAPLPGVSFRGYYPVVAPDGAVLVTTTPGLPLGAFDALMLEMVKAVFGDFASWRHDKAENARLREANFALLARPETYRRQMEYLRSRLAKEPAYRTFFVLDPQTGKERCLTPIVYAESMNGGGMPPIVTAGGRVVVKFQALLRSRYESYSPFLNVGYLNTDTGDIEPALDETRTYGWFDGLLLVADEQSQLSAAGQVLINTHQDSVCGLDLKTRRGYAAPFARNIHEPQPGEALALWRRIWRGEPLPQGKEWLARGTAPYGGGSAIDVAVAIAGDSFYYVPTHELNAGAALIAYRMQPDAREPAPVKLDATLTDEEWRRVQSLPWDWDTLETERLRSVLASLPGPVPGTRRKPLTDEAAEAAAIGDAALDAFIWQDTSPTGPSRAPAELRGELDRAVDELISHDWQPLLTPPGKHPAEAYRFFVEPAETLETLAWAYPYIAPPLQARVRRFVAERIGPGGPFAGGVGALRFPAAAGEVRSLYAPPPERLLAIRDDIVRCELARLYAFWLWRRVSGEDAGLRAAWPDLRRLVASRPDTRNEDCGNGIIAGLIAYCRLARDMGDLQAVLEGVAAARAAMRERVGYELAHPRGGIFSQVEVGRTIVARWRNLTPEVGALLATHAASIQQGLWDTYVDYHRPAWWVAWNVELLWRNEVPFALPTTAYEIFSACALILGKDGAHLQRYLDIPWCRADLFAIRKLAFCVRNWT